MMSRITYAALINRIRAFVSAILAVISFNLNLRLKLFGLLALLICTTLAARADEFEIRLSGAELQHVTAINIELEILPAKQTRLEENLLISKNTRSPSKTNFIFKNVDQEHSSIKVFFTRHIDFDEFKVTGVINRLNYSGPIEVKIKNINLVPDFGYDILAETVVDEVKITKVDSKLPFMGVTEASILGPNPRIFTKTMFVAVGDIETYGFKLDDSIDSITINGNEASLINHEIIAGYVIMDQIPESKQMFLDVVFNTDSKKVAKRLGPVKLIDSIDLR
jgi:hypothetical protein